ncbi:MAG: hypothetical protein Q8P24_20650 [Desulfobacterales bacterium]|nr:hypothetical protein [Desulfobacterales bacterium]
MADTCDVDVTVISKKGICAKHEVGDKYFISKTTPAGHLPVGVQLAHSRPTGPQDGRERCHGLKTRILPLSLALMQ